MSHEKLSPDQQEFIRRCTNLFASAGLAPSAGKTLSYLVVCRPPKQSSKDIQDALDLSSGSVSMATTLLSRAGLIDEVKLSGERKHYYEVKPDAFTRAIEQRVSLSVNTRKLAEYGLESDPENPRLINMRDTYALLEKAILSVFTDLDEKRSNRAR